MVIKDFDVIVVGAGHAGIEAAFAASKLKKKVLLSYIDKKSIGHMPCNPAIGGTGKGQLVREIDALGGEMAKAIDKVSLQTKMLNISKGAAVHSPRAQADKLKYHEYMVGVLKKDKNITMLEDEAIDIKASEKRILEGIVFKKSGLIKCKTAVLALGTYLNGLRLRGSEKEKGGPLGFAPSNQLSKNLKKKGLPLRRFKTGTPARADKNTVNFSVLDEQKGDEPGILFSFSSKKANKNKISCYLTYTNKASHKIVKKNLPLSALYGGKTTGVGPRYCLCIEDKVVRFPKRDRHQVFLEPESLYSSEVYLQGLNINLPKNKQKEFYRSIKGLENVKIINYGYTIEYDCLSPEALDLSLESKFLSGLFFAGQIIGSSGYEEAAASGLIAGINASRKIEKKTPFVLRRDEAYIGVLIDDLITKLPDEPYRIMTSRAEYRLLLRQDNADERLTKKGYDLGLVPKKTLTLVEKKYKHISLELKKIKQHFLSKKEKEILMLNPETKISIFDVLKKPNFTYNFVFEKLKLKPSNLSLSEIEQVEIRAKYDGFIKMEEANIKKMKKEEGKSLLNVDFSLIKGLKKEAAEKLTKVQPKSIAQAKRIPGVSPSDILVLLIFLDQNF